MARVCVLTPTYNRGNLLQKLYDSLKIQTDNDFEWVVSDDGSTDGTGEKVSNWRGEGAVAIRYFAGENGGKHRALNRGLSQINDHVLVFIVDSDDYLPPKAIETIKKYHAKYAGDEELCGYSFLRFDSKGEVNTAYFPENEKKDTYLNVRINGNIGGDKAEVFYSEILKNFPFPEIQGEKFMAEDVVWMQMSEKYKMIHINECIYFCDYLEGGLTKSGRRMKLKSPRGMVLRSLIYLNNPHVKIKVKIKMMLLCQIYARAAGMSMSQLICDMNNRLMFMAVSLPAFLLYKIWSSKYS